MAEKKLFMRMLTPERPLLEDQVDMVILRAAEGEMGILPGHESCAVRLDHGLLRVKRGDSEDVFFVMGGFATVERDKVVVMSELAGPPDRIEEILGEMERQRSQRKIDEAKWEHEITRAEIAIRRVLVGHDISAYSVLKGKGEESGVSDGLNTDNE